MKGKFSTKMWVDSDSLALGNPPKCIAQGDFGSVYKGTLKGKTVAVKRLKCEESKFHSVRKQLEDIGRNACHANVVAILGALLVNNVLYDEVLIITEYCANLDLHTYFMKRKENSDISLPIEESPAHAGTADLTVQTLVAWARSIAEGMSFLASKNIPHGNLTLCNMLLDSNWNVKIGGFGLTPSIMMEEISKQLKFGYFHAIWDYAAPEYVKTRVATVAGDVWSYGMVLWRLFNLGERPKSHFIPVYTADALYERKLKAISECPRFAPAEIIDMIHSCWKIKPEDRPSFEDILKRFSALNSTCFNDVIPKAQPEATRCKRGREESPLDVISEQTEPSRMWGTDGNKPVLSFPDFLKENMTAIQEFYSSECKTVDQPTSSKKKRSGGALNFESELQEFYELIWTRANSVGDGSNVHWSDLSTILNERFLRQTGAKRSLSQSNLKHMFMKLFGLSAQAAVPFATISRSVWNDALTNGSLKWFMKTTELIREHLLYYWDSGFILGFIDKAEAGKLLIENGKPGSFLLRFSDTVDGGVSVAFLNSSMEVVNVAPYTSEHLERLSLQDRILHVEKMNAIMNIMPSDVFVMNEKDKGQMEGTFRDVREVFQVTLQNKESQNQPMFRGYVNPFCPFGILNSEIFKFDSSSFHGK